MNKKEILVFSGILALVLVFLFGVVFVFCSGNNYEKQNNNSVFSKELVDFRDSIDNSFANFDKSISERLSSLEERVVTVESRNNEEKIILEEHKINFFECESDMVDEFNYSDAGENYNYKKECFFVLDLFSPKSLKGEAYECEKEKDLEYFEKLMSNYTKTDKGVKYSFEYGKPSQGRSSWDLIVIQNKIDKSKKDPMNDFGLCFAGGDRYPFKMNDNHLMFHSVCGGAYDDELDIPVGCAEVWETMEDTIMLK